MNDYIKSDLMRYYGKYDFLTFCKAYLSNSTFRFQVALRMYQMKGVRRICGIVLWHFSSTRKTIQIPLKTKIGYGLYIAHGDQSLLILLPL